MKTASPSPNGTNGRDRATGRFVKGNAGGPGNPHAAHVGSLRRTMLNAVTAEDMRAVAMKLVEMAKRGNIHAIKELLDRTLGKSQEADLLERIEQLEQILVLHQEEVSVPWRA